MASSRASTPHPAKPLPVWGVQARRAAGAAFSVFGGLILLVWIARGSDWAFDTALRDTWGFAALAIAAGVALAIALVCGAARLVAELVAGFQSPRS